LIYTPSVRDFHPIGAKIAFADFKNRLLQPVLLLPVWNFTNPQRKLIDSVWLDIRVFEKQRGENLFGFLPLYSCLSMQIKQG
jgi:hypothetical protein